MTDEHFSEEEEVIIFKPKKKNPKKRNRKIEYVWDKPKEVSRLIAAVKKRPALWDFSCSEYKKTYLRNHYWEEVAEELGIDNVDSNGAKYKWNSVRCHFKANLRKFRERNYSHGEDQSISVQWPHFLELLFIESGEVEQSHKSLDLKNATNDRSIMDYLCQSIEINSSAPTPTPLPSPIVKRRKCNTMRSPFSSQTTTKSDTLKDFLSEVMCDLRKRSAIDRFSSFGELIAGHLRNLPATEAIELESCLSQTLYGFLGSRPVSVK